MATSESLAPSFEQGPIRPPNEQLSLLVRVTRNCPYNRCTFCPVYKGQRFSLRSAGEVKADIDAMAELAERLREVGWRDGRCDEERVAALLYGPDGAGAAQVARFLAAGAGTAFLQDANSLIAPVEELRDIIAHLRLRFPSLRRVTSYARSHTITGRSVAELVRLREAGLSRIHVGLESGADRVLELVGKGAGAERHIDAGRRVRAAAIGLCEYVMPGLGGRALSDEHARETARVLRAIEPDFVRLRTVTVPVGSALAAAVSRGQLEPASDVEIVAEIRALLCGLEGVRTTIRSDHVLNLLEEVSGRLPEELPRLLGIVDQFLSLGADEQELFAVGRRLGSLRRLDDLDDGPLRARAEQQRALLRRRHAGPLDVAIRELTSRFV